MSEPNLKSCDVDMGPFLSAPKSNCVSFEAWMIRDRNSGRWHNWGGLTEWMPHSDRGGTVHFSRKFVDDFVAKYPKETGIDAEVVAVTIRSDALAPARESSHHGSLVEARSGVDQEGSPQAVPPSLRHRPGRGGAEVSKLTASQWLVLDNVKNRWPYATNLAREYADPAYLWLVNNEYIKDGAITDLGTVALMLPTETPYLRSQTT